jgi:2-polyprenyl-3-methyl-5-hydroxy-6-metoxy-1,4-benzoquinol methylase
LLAERAWILVDNADFTSVYDGLKGVVLNNPAFRFEEIHIDYTHGSRAGQGVALLSFESVRTAAQLSDEIPVSKNKQLADRFIASTPLLEKQRASSIVDQALVKWVPISDARSDEVFKTLQIEFPDGASPKTYWHEAYKRGFTDFFAWGHDQDFGFGRTRQGTMSTRHVEIVSESIEYGYLPERLTDLDVLDVGCWTGGDVLALAGMGARVTALEEHPISAAAAKRMCDLLGVSAEVHSRSLYSENSEWMGKFDVVYISGVIYHVTDPVLALRICFAYLKPGGRIVVETKASKLEGALCEYGGTHEKGWNWYSPTLETFGRWLVDAGFPRDQVRVHMRPVGRLLAGAVKGGPKKLPERAGFSRPNSWLESAI